MVDGLIVIIIDVFFFVDQIEWYILVFDIMNFNFNFSFSFLEVGIYDIQLMVINICGFVIIEKSVILGQVFNVNFSFILMGVCEEGIIFFSD